MMFNSQKQFMTVLTDVFVFDTNPRLRVHVVLAGQEDEDEEVDVTTVGPIIVFVSRYVGYLLVHFYILYPTLLASFFVSTNIIIKKFGQINLVLVVTSHLI